MPDRVYLKDPKMFRHSKHHTHYSGTGPIQHKDNPGRLYKTEFINGVARNVDDETFRRLKDEGVASATRPRVDED